MHVEVGLEGHFLDHFLVLYLMERVGYLRVGVTQPTQPPCVGMSSLYVYTPLKHCKNQQEILLCYQITCKNQYKSNPGAPRMGLAHCKMLRITCKNQYQMQSGCSSDGPSQPKMLRITCKTQYKTQSGCSLHGSITLQNASNHL